MGTKLSKMMEDGYILEDVIHQKPFNAGTHFLINKKVAEMIKGTQLFALIKDGKCTLVSSDE